MRILPRDTLLIDSPLPPAEALARLQAATSRPRSVWILGPVPRPFEGTIADGEVRIQRAVGYHNAFVPHIQGRVDPRDGGSRLLATMTLQRFATLFLCVWYAGSVIAGVSMLVRGAAGGFRDPAAALLPLQILLFGWAVATAAFAFEVRQARSRLAELLGAGAAADAARPRPA